MNHFRIHLSPNIIIPFVFAGISCLSALVAFRIAESYYMGKSDLFGGILVWIGLISVISFGFGLLIVKMLLKPAEGFVEKAEKIPVLSSTRDSSETKRSLDKLEHYSRVFDQVTTLLSKVDVRQLFPDVIGESKAMRSVLSQVVKVAPLDSTVLIIGESGTGKELIASSIYEQSRRKNKPFIKLNCAAIPEGLLESELFGHEKGAFTGATAAKKGKFELADGGTLFLDEIGDMPVHTQAKILRVLQEKEIERVGGTVSKKVDVRFIAATNKNLEDLVESGAFREDLYYRLNVFTIFIPPLRDRTEDIPLLTRHMLDGLQVDKTITTNAYRKLIAYNWPGNVRELNNVIEQAVVLCEGEQIEGVHFPMISIMETDAEKTISLDSVNENEHEIAQPDFKLDDHLGDIEVRIIEKALMETNGVQVKAAELLGINQRSLWHRIKKYGINVKDFKVDN